MIEEQKERLRQLTDIVLATAQVREDSRLLFCAKFLKNRIGAQRIPERIKP